MYSAIITRNSTTEEIGRVFKKANISHETREKIIPFMLSGDFQSIKIKGTHPNVSIQFLPSKDKK